MPDILTRADKSYTEVLKELQSKPHTVYAGRYYCLRVGYVWYLQETHCRNCGTQITHFEQGKENSLPTPENASERNSGSSGPIPASSATPETLRISLPALRAVILGVIDDGMDGQKDEQGFIEVPEWYFYDLDESAVNETRLRFCDKIERRLWDLTERKGR